MSEVERGVQLSAVTVAVLQHQPSYSSATTKHYLISYTRLVSCVLHTVVVVVVVVVVVATGEISALLAQSYLHELTPVRGLTCVLFVRLRLCSPSGVLKRLLARIQYNAIVALQGAGIVCPAAAAVVIDRVAGPFGGRSAICRHGRRTARVAPAAGQVCAVAAHALVARHAASDEGRTQVAGFVAVAQGQGLRSVPDR